MVVALFGHLTTNARFLQEVVGHKATHNLKLGWRRERRTWRRGRREEGGGGGKRDEEGEKGRR